jgi:hypothetical protein
MSPHINLRWTAASMLALLAAACGASNAEGPVSTTTTTNAPIEMPASVAPAQAMTQAQPLVVQGENAASQIASARCTHEDACGNIGPGREYSSFDVCVGDLRLEHLQRLTGQVCAHGVDPYALPQCVEDVRNQPCGEPAPASCAGMRLCR